MFAKTLILLAILIGCGPQGNNTAAVTPGSDVSGQNITSQTDPKSIAVGAQLFDKKIDLPECTDAIARQLVYVSEESQFYYCSEGEWTAIDLKGPKGEKGDKGDQGIAGEKGDEGDKGEQGNQGAKGVAGTNGQDAVTVGANEWLDPVSGEKWVLGLFISPADIARSSTCAAGSHAPDDAEMKTAASRGIFAKLGSYFNYSGSQFLAIVYTEQENPTSWIVHGYNLNNNASTANRIVSSDFSTTLPTWWTTKTYVICIID